MSELLPPDGEEFGVELQWPHGVVKPAEVTPGPSPDAPNAERTWAPDGGEPLDVASLRRVLVEYLGGRTDELARMNAVLRQLRTGVDDAAAALHRLAASTVALSGEVTALVEVTRRSATQTASLVSLAEASGHRLEDGLGELRAEIARVADEVSTVRRRIPVQARDAAAPR